MLRGCNHRTGRLGDTDWSTLPAGDPAGGSTYRTPGAAEPDQLIAILTTARRQAPGSVHQPGHAKRLSRSSARNPRAGMREQTLQVVIDCGVSLLDGGPQIPGLKG